MKTLASLFIDAAKVEKLQVFFKGLDTTNSFSYSQLYQDAQKVAFGLRENGVIDGEIITLMYPTGPDFYRSFFGVLLAGAVPCALYPPARLGKLDQWKKMIQGQNIAVESKLMLVDGKLYGMAKNIGLSNINIKTISQLSESEGKYDQHQRSKDALAFVQFSSGTTSFPKAVMISNENIHENISAILKAFPEFNEKRRAACVSWLPLYHDMGLVGCLIGTLAVKGELTLIRPEHFLARPILWLEALSETKAPISVAPNFAFGLCCKKIDTSKVGELDLSHWEMALCGAEAVSPKVLQNFSKKFSKYGFSSKALTPVYGMSETTLAATFSPLHSSPRYQRFDKKALEYDQRAIAVEEGGIFLACLGSPLDKVSLTICNQNGTLLEDSHVGRVYIKGPSVMKGYFGQKDKTLEVLKDGIFFTGDLGFLYKDELYLCGREKDVLIINGRNYDPSLIENSLLDMKYLRSGCLAIVSHSFLNENTEELVVFSEVSNEKIFKKIKKDKGFEESIKKNIFNSILAENKLKVSLCVLLRPSVLPRTSSGKIRRRESLRTYLNGDLVKFQKKTGPFWDFLIFLKETILGLLKSKL